MNTELTLEDRFFQFLETIGFGSYLLGFIFLALGLIVLFLLAFK